MNSWRTRYLLPMEILSHLVMLTVGLSGWLGYGYLKTTLVYTGNVNAWALLFVPAPAIGLFICSLEWFFGRKWCERRVHISMSMRKWFSFLSFCMWAICLYILTTTGGTYSYVVILQAPVMMVVVSWSWWVNARTLTIRDPRHNTTKLQEKLSNDPPFW